MDEIIEKNESIKKIGIMTWFHHHNYGGVLQATALSWVIDSLSYRPIMINYKSKYRIDVMPKSEIILKVISKIKNKFNNIILKKDQKNISVETGNKYNKFISNNLIISETRNDFNELEKTNKEMDAFICGSDQIWSPNNFDPHYFLDFVHNSDKMISYAPSIGLSTIDNLKIKNEMSKLISRFKYLSIREIQGAKIINELTGLEPKIVLDPTLLLDKKAWDSIINKNLNSQERKSLLAETKTDYALVYLLAKNEEYWKLITKISSALDLNIKIIPIFNEDLDKQGCLKTEIGPAEFLQLFSNAKYVFTDSFHGTIFSLIYNTNFCVFERFKSTDKINQNSRIHNLLEMLGLENRLFNASDDYEVFLEPIDFLPVDKKIKEKKVESINFLIDSLP